MRMAAIIVLLGGVAALSAQDAVQTLPANYRVVFENTHVRVTRVHYPAHAKLPGHSHTSLPTAYVYLNDSGPVVFRHIGLDYGAVTRPPTVARSYRLFRGLEEIHEVENQSPKPSDFLRVEFKTDPGPDPRTLRGKFLPPPLSELVQRLEFENAQLRVTRLVVPAGSHAAAASSTWPSVFVSLTAEDLGRATWADPGQTLSISGEGAAAESLRFELKTGLARGK